MRMCELCEYANTSGSLSSGSLSSSPSHSRCQSVAYYSRLSCHSALESESESRRRSALLSSGSGHSVSGHSRARLHWWCKRCTFECVASTCTRLLPGEGLVSGDSAALGDSASLIGSVRPLTNTHPSSGSPSPMQKSSLLCPCRNQHVVHPLSRFLSLFHGAKSGGRPPTTVECALVSNVLLMAIGDRRWRPPVCTGQKKVVAKSFQCTLSGRKSAGL